MCDFILLVSYSDNVVLYNHIMILRDKLDKLQHLKGLKSDEKGNLVKCTGIPIYIFLLGF